MKLGMPMKQHSHPSLLDGVRWYSWPTLVNDLKPPKRAFHKLDDIRDANVVFLDEIGVVGDTSFVAEQLYRAMESRAGKWMVMTSNLGIGDIRERIDTRVASRMIRDGNLVVEMNTLDFALRPK